ncbi:MAG: hypothetical protein ABIE22_00430 [archaeon]
MNESYENHWKQREESVALLANRTMEERNFALAVLDRESVVESLPVRPECVDIGKIDPVYGAVLDYANLRMESAYKALRKAKGWK